MTVGGWEWGEGTERSVVSIHLINVNVGRETQSPTVVSSIMSQVPLPSEVVGLGVLHDRDSSSEPLLPPYSIRLQGPRLIFRVVKTTVVRPGTQTCDHGVSGGLVTTP